jgi:hypothetical protein
MPRLPHGKGIALEEARDAGNALASSARNLTLGLPAARPGYTQDFGFLFPELQEDPDNLLPERRQTREALVELGRTMLDTRAPGDEDPSIPAAYTYFGQFVDHDITFETASATLPDLIRPDLIPLPLDQIEDEIHNARTATLELDSIYGVPAPRTGARMGIGQVTALNGGSKPYLRPPGKGDANDLPREGRSSDAEHDRAALIGDPRNDENLIIAQLHLAFLLAHNTLVERGATFGEARRRLCRHYQHIVLHDFLKRIADPQIVDDIIENGNRIFHLDDEKFFMPLEFSVAAYRFGHSMLGADYDFNLNFNTSGEAGTDSATLGHLFTLTALSGELGDFDTLPDNWIIEWENFVDVGAPFNRVRRIDTKLVEPLFELPDLQGRPQPEDHARLAVLDLLRGYLLRIPTGQAVARVLQQRLQEVRDIPVLSANQVRNGAASHEQVQVLEDAGFLQRTPLWYYILAEAAVLQDGQRLGPVGSTIVAEVLVGLVSHSEHSILRAENWEPNLPRERPDTFTLIDLLRFAGVL